MDLTNEQRQFIDDFASQWERMGANVTQGRILALLFIVPSREVTASDIAATLGISRGAVSQLTRQLIHMRLVQRVSHPGDRRDWFRVPPNPLGEAARSDRAQIQALIDLMHRGLSLTAGHPDDSSRALTNTIAFLQDYDAALGAFLESWRPPDETEHP